MNNEIRTPDFTEVYTGDSLPVEYDFAKLEQIYGSYGVAELKEVPEKMYTNNGIAYHEIIPEGDMDEGLVTVRFLEAGNDLTPHQYASALMIAKYFGHRVIVFPHNDFKIQRGDRRDVSLGRLGSVVTELAHAIESLTDEDELIHGEGASLGAQVVIPTMTTIAKTKESRKVASTVALENPNTRLGAGVLSTAFAFSKAGEDKVREAIHQAGWPSLSELIDEPKYFSDSNSKFVKNFILNRDFITWMKAMSMNSLPDDVRQHGGNIVIARDVDSAMTDEKGVVEAVIRNDNALGVTINSRLGHAASNLSVERIGLDILARERASRT